MMHDILIENHQHLHLLLISCKIHLQRDFGQEFEIESYYLVIDLFYSYICLFVCLIIQCDYFVIVSHLIFFESHLIVFLIIGFVDLSFILLQKLIIIYFQFFINIP